MHIAGRVDVVAAVIRKNGAYLVCRRNLAKHHGGLWEFPGGKVAEGESFKAALARELVEELEVELVSTNSCLYSGSEENLPFVIHFVECQIEGDPVRIEHEEIEWVTLEQLLSFELAPVDKGFVAQLHKET